jgi:hypothetical protein
LEKANVSTIDFYFDFPSPYYYLVHRIAGRRERRSFARLAPGFRFSRSGKPNGAAIIGKLLGYTRASIIARYAHLAPDPVKAAAAAVADKMSGTMRRAVRGA